MDLFLRGTSPTDSAARVRSIRISNLIGASAVANTLCFLLIALYLNDPFIAWSCVVAASLYAATTAITMLGYPNLGRPLNLIAGCCVVMLFACHFRGESMLQMFLYILAVAPFMYFSWEERRWYWLAVVPVIFIIIGEATSYQLFPASDRHYNMSWVRIFTMLAPLSQIMMGFFHFLKQSVMFEAESLRNLKQLELEYQKQIQVQKMSSLGEMSAGISHEVNNPLMVVMGGIHNLRRHMQDNSLTPEVLNLNLSRIETTAKRIEKIVGSLRKFSRNAEHDPCEITTLKSIVEDSLDLCQERFKQHGIKLTVEMENDLKINCRPGEIAQVLINLLNNAFDALENVSQPEIEIRTRSLNDKQIEIRVSDNGPGIPAEITEKIMQPFFTTKDVGRGTGLGLSISKGLIEGHHGSLSYLRDSKTHFQIILNKIRNH